MDEMTYKRAMNVLNELLRAINEAADAAEASKKARLQGDKAAA